MGRGLSVAVQQGWTGWHGASVMPAGRWWAVRWGHIMELILVHLAVVQKPEHTHAYALSITASATWLCD